MSTERNERNENRSRNEQTASKLNPGTLNNTDPQENMEGPVSSLMHDAGEQFDSGETKLEAEEEREKGM